MQIANPNHLTLAVQDDFPETSGGVSSIFSLKRKQVIFYEGHPASGVYCVRRVRVKIYKMGFNGRPHILFFANPGEFLGLECVVAGAEYSTSGQMMVEGEVAFIEKRKFIDLINANLPFALHV